MTPEAHRDIQYSLDRFVVSGRRVFCWGWVADRTRAVREASLLLEGEGWQTRLEVVLGLDRQDVERTFPGWVNAAVSGFVVTGYMPGPRPQRMVLEIRFSDSSVAEIDVSHVARMNQGDRAQRRQLAYLLGAVWRRLRIGDFKGILRRARSQNYGAAYIDERDVVRSLLPLVSGLETCLVFDHNMGGGANQYRRRIDRRAPGGRTSRRAVHVQPAHARLSPHGLPAGRRRGDRVPHVVDSVGWSRFWRARTSAEMFVNSPVSFDEPLVFADWIASMRTAISGHAADGHRARLLCRLSLLRAAQRGWPLLRHSGCRRMCIVPEAPPASYVALSPPTEIGPWRALWGTLPAGGRRGALLFGLDAAACCCAPIPTSTAHASCGRAASSRTTCRHACPGSITSRRLVIGIIGQISEQKGALVVKEMVALIDREHLDVRVVVIGTLDVALESERLRVTGTYRREELVDLIEANRDQPVLLPVDLAGDVFLRHRGDDPARRADRRVRPRRARRSPARLRARRGCAAK